MRLRDRLGGCTGDGTTKSPLTIIVAVNLRWKAGRNGSDGREPGFPWRMGAATEGRMANSLLSTPGAAGIR
jgi:hypothetical protein